MEIALLIVPDRSFSAIVLVDAYSSGYALVGKSIALGEKCIHVKSRRDLPSMLVGSIDASIAKFCSQLDGSVGTESIVAQLSGERVNAVIAGSESGVLLADQLAEALQVPYRNDLKSSASRRDKLLMHRAAEAAGLTIPIQAAVGSTHEASDFVKSTGLVYPIIVKPLMSAGTDMVTMCSNEMELLAAVAGVLRTPTLFGDVNEKALVQEYIDGDEYIVDTMSFGGDDRVIFTDIWKYTKGRHNGSTFVYEHTDLLPFAGVAQADLKAYMSKLLRALKIDYGPAHGELKINSKGKIVLIEVAARPPGGNIFEAVEAATETDTIDLAIRAFTRPGEAWAAHQKEYKLYKHVRNVHLINSTEGICKGFNFSETIASLPSFFKLIYSFPVGGRVPKTIDYLTKSGTVKLLHQDQSQILTDTSKVRELESIGLFKFESDHIGSEITGNL